MAKHGYRNEASAVVKFLKMASQEAETVESMADARHLSI